MIETHRGGGMTPQNKTVFAIRVKYYRNMIRCAEPLQIQTLAGGRNLYPNLLWGSPSQ